MAILKRTERTMCGIKSIEKRSSQELKDLLGVEKIVNRQAKTNGMRWYEQVLKWDSDDGLRKTLDFEGVGRRRGE